MRLTPSLVAKVTAAYPDLQFSTADSFLWSPDERTVYYASDDPSGAELLLHELSHGLLQHDGYQKDVELLALERQAWDRALQIAPEYTIPINQDTVQDHLDTYREWLHARSTCPKCEATGYQTDARSYRCPACSQGWRVNEARICGLKRYKTKTPR